MTTYSPTFTPMKEQEYRIVPFWRYLLYVFLISFLGLVSWLGYDMMTDAKSDLPAAGIFPVMLLIIGGCAYLLARIHRENLVIKPGYFVHTKVYRSQTLSFNDVAGYKINENYISIIPLAKGIKKISITTYLARKDQLLQFLAANFTNLDLSDYETQLAGILSDPSLGTNEADREQLLNKAKDLCNLINWPSYLVAGLVIFHDKPSLTETTIALLYPLLALLVFKSNPLIRFDEEKTSPYPSVAIGFIMPLAGFGVRLVSDLSLLNFASLWVSSGIMFGVLTLILIPGNNAFSFQDGRKVATSVMITLSVYLYAIAAVVAVNCFYDRAVPIKYQVLVTDKNITRGKSTSYHLVLERWGPQESGEEERVSSDLYARTQIGDKVTVTYRPGLLAAAWYTID
jgi:hypothetical protein